MVKRSTQTKAGSTKAGSENITRSWHTAQADHCCRPQGDLYRAEEAVGKTAESCLMTTVAQFAFDSATHTYKLGELVVPSVTQVLANVGLVDYGFIKDEVLARASERGDIAHEACAFLDRDVLDWDTLHPEISPYIFAWERARKDIGFVHEADGVERSGVHTENGMSFGYTIDRRGKIGKRPYLLELKCTAEEEASWRIQLAAYALASGTPEGKAFWGVAAVQLRPDGDYRVYDYSEPSSQDQKIFLAALALTWWKINHGLRWRE
jgi:hypothetical protein